MSGFIENFGRSVYLSYKGLFLWLNWPGYLSSVVLRPAIFVVMVWLVGSYVGDPDQTRNYLIGMASFGAIAVILAGTIQCFFYQQTFGTLPLVASARSSQVVQYVAYAGLHPLNGAITLTVSILSWGLLPDIGYGAANWALVCIAALILLFSSSTFGLLIANLALVYRDWFSIQVVAFGFLLLFAGVIIPVGALPTWIQWVSEVIPLTHALAAMREGFAGAAVGTATPDLLLEVGLGCVYLLAGMGGHALVMHRLRSNGMMGVAT